MAGKHRNWHAAWRRDGARLLHESGLAVEYDEVLGWTTTDGTIQAWSASEENRGVPLHDLQARLQRLLREASMWRDGDIV